MLFATKECWAVGNQLPFLAHVETLSPQTGYGGQPTEREIENWDMIIFFIWISVSLKRKHKGLTTDLNTKVKEDKTIHLQE